MGEAAEAVAVAVEGSVVPERADILSPTDPGPGSSGTHIPNVGMLVRRCHTISLNVVTIQIF